MRSGSPFRISKALKERINYGFHGDLRKLGHEDGFKFL